MIPKVRPGSWVVKNETTSEVVLGFVVKIVPSSRLANPVPSVSKRGV